jgi:peptidoglycan/LPS O-acetylase OafA/YrhL
MLDGAVFVACAVIAAAIFGILVHLFVEQPLLRRINAALRGRRPPPAAAEFANR